MIPRRYAPLLLVLCAPLASQTRPYHAIDLGVVPSQPPQAGVTASDISRDGNVIGGMSVFEPYVWERGSGMRALQKLPGYLNGWVYGVNGAGVAVGSCGLLTHGSTPIIATVWDPAGVPITLPPLGRGTGGSWSRALGINDAGQVIGVTTGVSGAVHAFSWTPSGGMVDLTPTAQSSSALDLNERGQIVLVVDGTSYRLTPGQPLLPLGNHVAERINEFGQMVGQEINGGAVSVYTDGIGWQTLPSAVGFTGIGGINGFGQVVATQWVRVNISPPSYDRFGHVYTPGLGFQRLENLVQTTPQVRVGTTSGIDEKGNITADGSFGPDNRAMLIEQRFVALYGGGCPGTGGVAPRLIGAGLPAAGGRIALLGGGGARGGAGVLLLSRSPASLPLPGGCTLLVDLSTPVAVPVAFNPIGQGHAAFDLPARVPRVSLFAQLASIDAGAGNGVFTLSNGVRIDLQ